jgi:hypothetical protein
MFIELLVALSTAAALLWFSQYYLTWSGKYEIRVRNSEDPSSMKNGILYKIKAPKALQDSWKYVYFWGNYYWIKMSA